MDMRDCMQSVQGKISEKHGSIYGGMGLCCYDKPGNTTVVNPFQPRAVLEHSALGKVLRPPVGGANCFSI